MFQSYVFNSPSSVAAGFADSSGNTFTLAALGPTGSAIVNVTTTVDATAACNSDLYASSAETAAAALMDTSPYPMQYVAVWGWEVSSRVVGADVVDVSVLLTNVAIVRHRSKAWCFSIPVPVVQHVHSAVRCAM